MNLYRIEFDSINYYVAALDFTDAIGAWRRHVQHVWGADYQGDEQPDSVERIHCEALIGFPPADGEWRTVQQPATAETNDRFVILSKCVARNRDLIGQLQIVVSDLEDRVRKNGARE
nr:hypothetical protein [uncultured Rhodopila sp.]